MIEFFMPMNPPTKTFQDKIIRTGKNGKAIVHNSSEVSAIKNLFLGHLGRHKPAEKLEGPIRLVVKWCYPSTNKNVDGQYKTTKPDIDNSQKLLMDCMTVVGFWKDDSQVASLVAEKFWADIPGIYVRAEEIKNDME